VCVMLEGGDITQVSVCVMLEGGDLTQVSANLVKGHTRENQHM
jgi:hypothetical protein